MGLRQEMEITIGKNGEVLIHVLGVDGPKCLEFSKFLEEALGAAVRTGKTPEYYQESQTAETQLRTEG